MPIITLSTVASLVLVNLIKKGISHGIALLSGVPSEIIDAGVDGVADSIKGHVEFKAEQAAEQAAAAVSRHGYAEYEALPVADKIALIETLAQAEPEALLAEPTIKATIAALPDAKTQALAAAYVRALPGQAQRTQVRPADPSGNTATAQTIPSSPAELGQVFAAVPSTYRAGEAVPHKPGWRLECQLGGGGFGEVWLATKSGYAPVAVKFCKGGHTTRNLAMECKLVKRLIALAKTTPGIVPITDDFMDHHPPMLCYEYVPGCTLEATMRERQREGRSYAWGEAAGIITELAQTIAACHQLAEPICHRDLKPANILWDDSDPAHPRLRITDFGIGAVLDGGTGAALLGFTGGVGLGTNLYASPEQRAGQPQSPSDDIHALGIIWLQLLTGDLAEDQLDQPTRDGLLEEGQPEALLRLLGTCIASKAAKRPSAAEFLTQLRRAVAKVVPSFSSSGSAAAASSAHPAPPHSATSGMTEPDGLKPATTLSPPSAALIISPPAAWAGQLTFGHYDDEADYAQRLASLGYLEVASFTLPRHGWERSSGLFPLPKALAWHKDLPEPQRLSTELALHTTDRLQAASWDDGSTRSLLARTRAIGTGFWLAEPSVQIGSQLFPLVDLIAERLAEQLKPALTGILPQGVALPSKASPFTNGLGMKFVPVPTGPAGEAVLGSIYPTRRQDYAAYAAAVPGVDATWKDTKYEGQPVGHEDDHPVVGVSYNDAVAFCKWLTQRDRKAGLIGPHARYRLPTDDEWSWAVGIGPQEEAKATPEAKNGEIEDHYPWGCSFPPPPGSGNYADESANAKFPMMTTISCYDDGYPTTSPVGKFKPNDLGLYDLGGNVWEYCQDWYNEEQKERVLRGASWNFSNASFVLSSCRSFSDAAFRFSRIGFRCVLVAGVR